MKNQGEDMQKVIQRNEKFVRENSIHERNTSLDALRVLCMFLIVLGHAMAHGHVLDTLSPNSINYYIVNILRAFLSVHVNCFVLISGYFLCTYKFRLSKVFFIWWQTFFWSVTLYIFVCISGIVPFEIESLLRACLPFTQQRYWFVTTYLLMYVLIPLLNAAIHTMSQRQHAFFIATFFFIYIVLQNLFFWKKFTSTNSYDPLFFAFLYMIAAYFRLYPAKRTQLRYFLCYFLVCLFSAIWKIGMGLFTSKIVGESMGDSIFLSYSSITMVIASASLFRFFEGLSITNRLAQKVVTLLSSLTFGVYLIHEQPEIRAFLWEKLLRPGNYVQSPFLILFLLGIALFVFLLCALLEYLRNRVSELFSIRKLIIAISNRVKLRAVSLAEMVFNLKDKEK